MVSENCSAVISARFSRTMRHGVGPARTVGPEVLEREARVDRHVQPESRDVGEVREERAIAHREEHQAAPHQQHDHATEIHAVRELLPAQLTCDLVGIEQRQVDVHRALRGITQVEGAVAVGRNRQREQEVAMCATSREPKGLRSPVECTRQPPPGLGLVKIQRVDERIVLPQVDEPARVRRIADRYARPPGRRGEADIGRTRAWRR